MSQSIHYVVDKYREFLRQVSDDSVFTDEFLYSILIQARAELIKNQLDGNKDISPWMYQRFCIKLCKSNFIECKCLAVDFGCSVWRSTTPIPEFIMDNNSLILNISELYGDHINQVNERSFRLTKYRKYKNDYYYYIGDYNGDKYLFILGNKIPPKYVKAEGILADPSFVEEVACTEEECFDPLGAGFNLQLSNHNALFKLTTELLGISLKLPEDLSNNANSVEANKQI